MQLFVDSDFMFYMANILMLTIALLTSILVITFNNPVYVVLSLMFTFIATAICWVTLNAQFLAFTLILLYVGAITVLFLFVIMILDLKSSYQDPQKNINGKKYILKNHILKSLLITIGFGAIFIYISKDYSFSVTTSVANNNLHVLGQALFSDYILLFCMSALLLLSPMIAVICLNNIHPVNRKMQSIHQQTVVNKKERLKMLDVI